MLPKDLSCTRSSYLKLAVSVHDLFPSHTHTHCYAEGVLSKSDISLHSGIKALCTRADTWSLSLCQRGLARGLRCLEELGEFTPPTSCSTHTTIHRLLEVQARTESADPLNPTPHPYRQRHTHTQTHTHILRHTLYCTHSS